MTNHFRDPSIKLLWTDRIAEHAGNVSAAARAYDTPRQTVTSIINSYTPLSEDELKYHAEWTSSDCITELRRIAELHPTKVITRNYFRNAAAISEATWNRYFGSFLEFKRQAKLILSRHAHRLERSIAKHASVDKMREFNSEKRGWEGRYLMPISRRWQTAIIANDIHDIECDPFYRRVLIDTISRVQPEKLVLNGDIFDLPEFSKFSKDPRGWDVMKRIRWVHALLADFRAASPNMEIIFVEGNHEFRLFRHMTEETPALKVVLHELHDMTISKLLGLDQFGINLVARADLGCFTETDIRKQLELNYIKLWDNSLLYGHFPEMMRMGIPGGNGHEHKYKVTPFYSPVYGPSSWVQVGCGVRRRASFCAGEHWSQGFKLAHCDTKTRRTQFEYIDVSHDAVMIGGKFYQRDESEPVPDLI